MVNLQRMSHRINPKKVYLHNYFVLINIESTFPIQFDKNICLCVVLHCKSDVIYLILKIKINYLRVLH